MPPLTKEEIDKIMQDNLERISDLLDQRVSEVVQRIDNEDRPEFQVFRRNYGIYTATNLPVLPRGTEILLDLRAGASSGPVACYKSLGDKYVEAWVKIL